MQRSIHRVDSYSPPVVPGLPVYAKHYKGWVDHAFHYNGLDGMIIFFPALGGMHGPVIRALSADEAYSRARDLLMVNFRELDDEYAWAADIELVWIGSGRPLK